MRYSTKEAVRRGMARDSEQLAPRRGSDGAAFEEANREKEKKTKQIVGLLKGVGSGVNKFNQSGERLCGVTGVGLKRVQINTNKCGLDAHKVWFMCYFNQRFHRGARSLEMNKVLRSQKLLPQCVLEVDVFMNLRGEPS